MTRLVGKVAVVTGGASGVGRAIVERFLAEGASVVAFDRSVEKLSGLDRQVATVVGDVRSAADNRAAVDRALTEFGRLDVLVANAGIWDWNRRAIDLSDDETDAAFDEILAVNVKGVLHGARAAARPLAEARGAIVVTLSNAALYVNGGGPLYTASKHAALGLVRQLAFELAPRVRVNGVAIGAVATDLRGAATLGQAEMSITAMPLASAMPLITPLSGPPAAAELAGAYVMLADARDSGAMTGGVIEAHGGFGVRGIFAPAGGYDLDPAGDPTPAARAALAAAGVV